MLIQVKGLGLRVKIRRGALLTTTDIPTPTTCHPGVARGLCYLRSEVT